MMAISQANTVLDWQENLPSDEMPPDWMWHLDDEITVWFNEVKRKRDDKYGTSSDDEPDIVPMVGNELTLERRQ